MKQLIEIILTFNRIEINRQILSLTQIDVKSDLKFDNKLELINCKQIVIHSEFCQTIYFIKILNSCLNYRQKVFKRFKPKTLKKSDICSENQINKIDDNFDDNKQKIFIIKFVIKLKSIDHILTIDKNWNNRILNLVVIRFRVEDSLSWLSTLGGAYSSLGEYNINCAIKAGQISISQLGLASITGDPNIIAKCGIYMAFSLCQQHRKKEAIKMMRRTIYPFICKIKTCDKIIFSMYSSLCYRIKNF